MLTKKESIKADIFEAYRYMGGHGEMDEDERSRLLEAAELMQECIHPRVIRKVCDIDRDGSLSLSGTCLHLEGRGIEALLGKCESCVIFCASIGSESDALIRKWEIRDITFAAMLDACGSSAVERLCDCVEEEVSTEYSSAGFHLTDRFSPGYGDFPITMQKDFCSVLDTQRKIGVTVSESGIMIPRKSVTAIIGLSHEVQKHRETGCVGCKALTNCTFRKNGVTCYGQAV